MRILILDGNENQAVACVRSLGRAGHTATVGAPERWSKAGWSRWSAGTFEYPAPDRDVDSFVACVAAEASRQPGTLVLPLTERTMLPVSRDRDRIIAAGGRLVLPPHHTVLSAVDKLATTRLAASLGATVPATIVMASRDDVLRHGDALRYPVVVKPRSSQEMVDGARVRTTGPPLYARDAGELSAVWATLSSRCCAALVQEFVEGEGIGYFALARHGEVRAEFAHRRLRDVRPTGSGSCLRVSIAAAGAFREQGRALLRALGWHGVAMVEFRLTPDGTPVFLEVNGRFWNSLALATCAGVDFPALVAEMAERGDVPTPASYRTGVRCRWLLGDLRHLVEIWRGAPDAYPGRFPGRLRTLARLLVPVPGTHHDNFTLSDPLPELGDWLDFGLRRLGRTCGSAFLGRHKVWNAARSASRS